MGKIIFLCKPILFQLSSLFPDLRHKRVDASCQLDGCSSKEDVADGQPQTTNREQKIVITLTRVTNALAAVTEEYQEVYTYFCDYVRHYGYYQHGVCPIKLVSLLLLAIFELLDLILLCLRNMLQQCQQH
jgi:hypothetical protein